MKKIFITLLVLLNLFNLYLPGLTFGGEDHLFAKRAGITEHTPEFLSTPEEKIPEVIDYRRDKDKGWNKWLLGGAAAVVGATICLASCSCAKKCNGPASEGTIDVNW